MKNKWVSLGGFLFLVFSIMVIGGLFTESSVHTWYLGLKKASWNPPSWVFGPVWTILYVMIAVSGWLIYLKPSSKKRKWALRIYGAQLLLNVSWTFFFFYLRDPCSALIEIIFLFGGIAWTTIAFSKLSRPAYLLLIPYLLWTAYAISLNAATCILN